MLSLRYAPAALVSVAGVVASGFLADARSAPAARFQASVSLLAAHEIQIDGPPVGHTGGFGEPTCAECHTGSPLNEPGSTLEVVGLGGTYQPGADYRLTIRLRSFDMLAAGFQVTLRWDEGPHRGSSAGELRTIDDRIAIKKSDSREVMYAQHTLSGTKASGELAEWVFEWTAPTEAGSVVLHLAANSGNGDNSPLDDLIYTHRVSLQSAQDR